MPGRTNQLRSVTWAEHEIKLLLILFNGKPFNPQPPQNDQIHSNNSSAFADDLSECVCPFCRDGVFRVNTFYVEAN